MSTTGLPRVVLHQPDDGLVEVLREARYAVLRHPVACQAAFSALVAEGRRFAETPEGRAWRRRLAGSPLLRDLRVAWDMTTAELLQESPPTVLPTTFVDALLQFAAHPHAEALLARFQQQDGGGTL